MKRFVVFLMLGAGLASHAQTPPPPPATAADVLAGTATYKFVSPKVMADVGFGAPTNGVTATQATNIVNQNNAATATQATRSLALSNTTITASIGANDVWRIYADDDGQAYGWNIIGGHPQNYIAPNQPGVTIFGGATNDSSFQTYTNAVFDRFATIAGGFGHRIGAGSEASFIGAGEHSLIGDDSQHSAIVVGEYSSIGDLADHSFIGGGYHIEIGDGASYATVLGGYDNTNRAGYGTIGGGEFNLLTDAALFATIPGGRSNTVSGIGSAALGWGLNVTRNREVALGNDTLRLNVRSNGMVEATAGMTFTGNGGGLTNLLDSNSVLAGGTAATLPTSSALLDFGTTDPSLVLTNAGVYLLQAGANLIYNNWSADIAFDTVTIKLRRTSGTPNDITGGAVQQDLDTVMVAYTGPLGVWTTPALIYTCGGSETIQLWGSISIGGAGGSIQATSAWITAVRIR